MATVDKWFAVCAILALAIVTYGIIATGGDAANVGAAGAAGGIMTLLYAFGRGIYEAHH